MFKEHIFSYHTLKNILVPLEAQPPQYPSLTRSKIKLTPCPGRSRNVSAEDPLGRILAHFFPRLATTLKRDLLPVSPSKNIKEKMSECGMSGSPLAGAIHNLQKGEENKISNYIVKINVSKILTF
jgi:hypothetical protein